MSLINCEECGYEYSDQSSRCPKCGCPNRIFFIEKERQDMKDMEFEINQNELEKAKSDLLTGLIDLGISFAISLVGKVLLVKEEGLAFNIASFFLILFLITIYRKWFSRFGLLKGIIAMVLSFAVSAYILETLDSGLAYGVFVVLIIYPLISTIIKPIFCLAKVMFRKQKQKHIVNEIE